MKVYKYLIAGNSIVILDLDVNSSKLTELDKDKGAYEYSRGIDAETDEQDTTIVFSSRKAAAEACLSDVSDLVKYWSSLKKVAESLNRGD